jgi:hypothetical protein
MLRYGGAGATTAIAADAAAFLPALVRLAPALQDLTLRFDDRDAAGDDGMVLVGAFREFAVAAAAAAAEGVGMTGLRRLELGSVVVRGEDLLTLWGGVRRTVEVVSLREVVLVGGGCWGDLFREVRDMYGWVGFGLGRGDDAVGVVRGVGVEFSWLGEWRRGLGGGQGSVEGVVVFDRRRLEECGACLDGARGAGAERCRRACRHVSVRTSIAVGEREAERTRGLQQLLAAKALSTAELEEMRTRWDA